MHHKHFYCLTLDQRCHTYSTRRVVQLLFFPHHISLASVLTQDPEKLVQHRARVSVTSIWLCQLAERRCRRSRAALAADEPATFLGKAQSCFGKGWPAGIWRPSSGLTYKSSSPSFV